MFSAGLTSDPDDHRRRCRRGHRHRRSRRDHRRRHRRRRCDRHRRRHSRHAAVATAATAAAVAAAAVAARGARALRSPSSAPIEFGAVFARWRIRVRVAHLTNPKRGAAVSRCDCPPLPPGRWPRRRHEARSRLCCRQTAYVDPLCHEWLLSHLINTAVRLRKSQLGIGTIGPTRTLRFSLRPPEVGERPCTAALYPMHRRNTTD